MDIRIFNQAEPTPEPPPQQQQQPEPTPQASPQHSTQAPDFDAIAGELGPEPAPAADTSRLFRREDFAEQFFVGGLNISSALSGIKALAVEQGPEHEKALEAGGAIYDTVLEYPSFHWLISKDTRYLGRAMVIGAFVIPKAQAVALELDQRKRPKPAPQMAAKPSQEGAEGAPGVIPTLIN